MNHLIPSATPVTLHYSVPKFDDSEIELSTVKKFHMTHSHLETRLNSEMSRFARRMVDSNGGLANYYCYALDISRIIFTFTLLDGDIPVGSELRGHVKRFFLEIVGLHVEPSIQQLNCHSNRQ